MSFWIFQANPKHYDIDGALAELSEIRWRVPQYTEEISPGDEVIVWKSGKSAGAVGVGTVQSPPELLPIPAEEDRFVTADGSEGSAETRVSLSVRAIAFVSKQAWRDDTTLVDHQIVRAPMGTVFKLTEAEWEAAMRLFGNPEVPALEAEGAAPPDSPAPVFSWTDRRKDAYPLPGGYDAYFTTLGAMLQFVEDHRPARERFLEWLSDHFGSSATNSRHIASFLLRVGFVAEISGGLVLTPVAKEFLEDRDAEPLVLQLHARVRFIGEMLELLRLAPKTSNQLLAEANLKYGMGWTTNAQIQRRRGWLQSAELIVDTEDGFALTASGIRILGRMQVHSPLNPSDESQKNEGAEPMPLPVAIAVSATVEALIEKLEETSRRSDAADDFEYAIRDAMEFLGFRAEQIGGPGKTDVIADADLGRDDSYRVILDGKTTKAGGIGDDRIDWDTIDEHRANHEADYVAIAAPHFSGSERLARRAGSHDALLITVDDMASLLRQHDESPIGLDEYRPLFASGGSEVDMDNIASSVEARDRLVDVAKAVLAAVEASVGRVGSVTARDLYLLMSGDDDEIAVEQFEIQEALESLATPLIAALVSSGEGYRPGGPRRTALRRLSLLHDHFSE